VSVILTSYERRGDTTVARALWAPAFPASRCTSSYEATVAVYRAADDAIVATVSDEDHGDCGARN
jgi:hypothetical protein